MPAIVGVRLRLASKTLWFDPAGLPLAVGESVIVETERGLEIGVIEEAEREVERAELAAPLKPVIRRASEDDVRQASELAEKEEVARAKFREAINKHKLDMKPVDATYTFSGDRVICHFTAEDRVDFRDLVRDLGSELKVRVDMRQIGVRDEARMVGGCGHCGEQLCCSRFGGGEFQPVSIKMAKEQDLSLNPLKISGLCGRLMCCLRYEVEAYKDFKSRAPRKGEKIDTPVGEGAVAELHTPRERVTVRIPQAGSITVPLAAMKCGKDKGCPCSIDREALDESKVSLSAQAMSMLTQGDRPLLEPAGEPKPRRPRGESTRSKSEPKGEQKAEPKRESKRRPRRGPKEETPAAAEPPSGEQAPRRRRRRRRSGGSGGSSGAPAKE
ncbi:MAG: tpl protein [Actinobacteria bacterium]|nr:tpl protein [Actinomycetota bacterium]